MRAVQLGSSYVHRAGVRRPVPLGAGELGVGLVPVLAGPTFGPLFVTSEFRVVQEGDHYRATFHDGHGRLLWQSLEHPDPAGAHESVMSLIGLITLGSYRIGDYDCDHEWFQLSPMINVRRCELCGRREWLNHHQGIAGSTGPTTAEEALEWLRSEEICGFAGGGGLSVKALVRLAVWNYAPDRGGDPRIWEHFLQARRLLEEEGLL